jgi:hypothetical protein
LQNVFLRPKIKILRDGSFFCSEVTSRFFSYAFYIYASAAQALSK